MENKNRIELVKQSFGRCLSKGDLAGRFYEIFLSSHADIASFFENTNFASQKQLLRQGINLAIMFADGSSVGKSAIDRVRDTHSAKKMNIPTRLYPYWKNSFIQTVSELDPEFTPSLGRDWGWVLQKAIDHIVQGYHSPQEQRPQRID